MSGYNPFGSGSKEQLDRQYDDLQADRQEALARVRAKRKKEEEGR